MAKVHLSLGSVFFAVHIHQNRVMRIGQNRPFGESRVEEPPEVIREKTFEARGYLDRIKDALLVRNDLAQFGTTKELK